MCLVMDSVALAKIWLGHKIFSDSVIKALKHVKSRHLKIKKISEDSLPGVLENCSNLVWNERAIALAKLFVFYGGEIETAMV